MFGKPPRPTHDLFYLLKLLFCREGRLRKAAASALRRLHSLHIQGLRKDLGYARGAALNGARFRVSGLRTSFRLLWVAFTEPSQVGLRLSLRLCGTQFGSHLRRPHCVAAKRVAWRASVHSTVWLAASIGTAKLSSQRLTGEVRGDPE